jgi:F0F1-type ATP synthase assembly protein I
MIKNLLSDDEPSPESESNAAASTKTDNSVLNLFDPDAEAEKEDFVISHAEPQSSSETVRQSGLAWSAGIAFFGAVVFMLILGWGADVLLGTSPWGIVGGIVLGSIIGFVQFFRLSSQIFKK